MLWVVYTLCPAGQSRSRGWFGLSFLPPSSSLKSLPSCCLRRFRRRWLRCIILREYPNIFSARFRIRKDFFHSFEIIFVRKSSTLLRSLKMIISINKNFQTFLTRFRGAFIFLFYFILFKLYTKDNRSCIFWELCFSKSDIARCDFQGSNEPMHNAPSRVPLILFLASIIITRRDICGLACITGRCEECPSREWCNAHLAINQTSRSGAAPGSMSEIGNVPIFSGSESRFREGPACARTTLAMIGVINAIIYGRLRALRRFEPPRVPDAARKRSRSESSIEGGCALSL